jgi:hypothetical protein
MNANKRLLHDIQRHGLEQLDQAGFNLLLHTIESQERELTQERLAAADWQRKCKLREQDILQLRGERAAYTTHNQRLQARYDSAHDTCEMLRDMLKSRDKRIEDLQAVLAYTGLFARLRRAWPWGRKGVARA